MLFLQIDKYILINDFKIIYISIVKINKINGVVSYKFNI